MLMPAKTVREGTPSLTFFLNCPQSAHPNGMESLSPGLRGTSYPGSDEQDRSTLKGLHRLLSMCRNAPIGRQKPTGCNPYRVAHSECQTQGSSFLATLG